MKQISFELFPTFNCINNLINKINIIKPYFISITCGKIDNYLFIKKNINFFKVNIVPHLICNEINNVLIKIILFIKLNIYNFLIITGDNYKSNSFYFVKKIRILFGHIIKIFSSIYSENHKLSINLNKEILFIYKKNKIGINCYFSQFFFNYNIINYFLKIINKTGINKNIIIGIFPKKKISEILIFSNYCKVEISNWILKNYFFFNLKNYLLKNIKNKNFHFYTFNNIKNLNYYFK
ncbi:methylenetetrahydrofolate reductase [Candidatus Carsonella ruddii]|uniref:Methylenetetrahydrofolate reductase n=1 Tax=Candidatus Carsonella ruddii CE isolate Thao2000 TaxID=1202536 RepID=J7GSQ0_CARRU|nr:methylenetetrahydrofolate reductase [Candidatus Carsonella ruddii]AFP83489.1 putative 5,10-methylenetetrahydrofolate reductase [Candidatus Carsonella ruddii CE isolate Thao2000]